MGEAIFTGCRDDICTYANNNVATESATSNVNQEDQTPNILSEIDTPNKEIINLRASYKTKMYSGPLEIYQELTTLEKGPIGTVKKVKIIDTEFKRAIKIIPIDKLKTPKKVNKIMDELKELIVLEHQNLAKISDISDDLDNIYIVSYFSEEGNLYNLLKKKQKLSENSVKYIMYQILNALSYLDSINRKHENLKLENVLISKISTTNQVTTIDSMLKSQDDNSKYEIKLCDYGYSHHVKKSDKTDFNNNDFYNPPESLKKDNYDQKAEIWACGIMMYLLLTGNAFATGSVKLEIIKDLRQGEIDFEVDDLEDTSKSCQDLLKKLLEIDPKKRININDALNHKFFGKYSGQGAVNFSLLKNILTKKNFKEYQWIFVSYFLKVFEDAEYEKNVKKIFTYLDTPNNGKLDIENIHQLLEENNINLPLEDTIKIFNRINYSQKNEVSLSEFKCAFCDEKELLKEENLQVAFNLMDRNKLGIINWNDIESVIFDKKKLSEEERKFYLDKMKIYKNTEISFLSFCNFFKNN